MSRAIQAFLSSSLDLADDERSYEATTRLSDPWGSVRSIESECQAPPRTRSGHRVGGQVDSHGSEKPADRGDGKAVEHAYRTVVSME